jgi:CheY-like chemotaxis protein
VAFDYSSLSVLLVDDSFYMRRIIRMLLSGFGVRNIEEAEDGAIALELFEQCQPDLVITDWMMPVFDGLELTRAIRSTDTSPSPYTAIIMMSGFCERSRVMKARDAGVTEFLAKPMSARGLYERIDNCIVNPRQFIRTQTFFGPDRRRFVFPSYSGEMRRQSDTAETEENPSNPEDSQLNIEEAEELIFPEETGCL